MKTLADHLRDADPLADGEQLAAADAASMRRRVLAAVPDRPRRVPVWSQAAAVAAVVLLVFAAGTRAGRQLEPVPAETAAPAAPALPEPRQLQFATPGGTRIIWVFDPDFSLQETVP